MTETDKNGASGLIGFTKWFYVTAAMLKREIAEQEADAADGELPLELVLLDKEMVDRLITGLIQSGDSLRKTNG